MSVSDRLVLYPPAGPNHGRLLRFYRGDGVVDTHKGDDTLRYGIMGEWPEVDGRERLEDFV